MNEWSDLKPTIRVPKQKSVMNSWGFVFFCAFLNLILFFIGYKLFYKPDPLHRTNTKLIYEGFK